VSTTPTISDVQQTLQAVEQVSVPVANEFIHSASGQATEEKVLGLTNVGIAALPVLASLFSNVIAPAFSHLGSLFHHAHAAATAANPQKPAA